MGKKLFRLRTALSVLAASALAAGGLLVFAGGAPPASALTASQVASAKTTASDPTGQGYWFVASDGGVFAFGTAGYYGSLPGDGIVPNKPIVGIVAAPTGKGYWLIGQDGGVYAFGSAQFLGSTGNITLNKPIVGGAAVPSSVAGSGVAGPQGPAGPKGTQGAQGPKGATGTTGPAGPQGPKGTTGATGDPGTPGAPGTPGTNGTDGTNALFTYGPYHVTTGDSSVCGTTWANDTLTLTFQVTPQSNGDFDVTVLAKGSFTTIAGVPQPNPASCPGTLQTGGVTGSLYGDYSVTTGKVTFDPYATFTNTGSLSGAVTGFFEATFGEGLTGTYAWQFHYRTASNGTWNDTTHGNTGNIDG
jgi:Collagen triple helix repeat (20 copies)